jgi:hypothetical protein
MLEPPRARSGTSVADGPAIAPRFVMFLVGLLGACVRAPEEPPCSPASPRGGASADARLTITEPDDAYVCLDGAVAGQAPVTLRVAPGDHLVEVIEGGHVPARRSITVNPRERRELAVDLEATRQRVAAWVVLSLGGAGLTATVVLGALSAVAARPPDGLRGGAPISTETPEADAYALGAGIAAGLGLSLVGLGGALFILDVPAGGTARLRRGRRRASR